MPPPPATSQIDPAPPERSGERHVEVRRRKYMRAFVRALTDPRTFDFEANPSVWLGLILALPIPVLVLFANAPFWIFLLSMTAPAAWAVILGAAGRVALLTEEEIRRISQAAAAKEKAHQAERKNLVQEVLDERRLREELEAAQRLLEAELKIAQNVQRTLIPADVLRPDVQVVVRNVPCSYVGGDYMQASLPRPDVLYLCIGDVSGHGVAAALVVSRIHGHVRRLILEQRPPEQFLEEMNRAVLRILQHTYFFMTFAVFRIDLKARRIDYATAGHPAQFLLRASGKVDVLSTPNRLLGIDADIFDAERPVDSVEFGPGDSLVLFTDGLFEVPDKEGGTLLGDSGLRERLANLGGLPPALIAGEILQDLADFQGTSKFEDDLSLMVARFEPVPAPTSAPAAAPVTAGARSGS
jgi:serine phosphatase RsbU (regulator of sigma subunit)